MIEAEEGADGRLAGSQGRGEGEGVTYLVLIEHSTERVEELERRDDLALYERRGQNRSCCPPAGAQWHLPEPGLEGEAGLRSHCAHLVHVHVTF
jgi:hypothetical protein